MNRIATKAFGMPQELHLNILRFLNFLLLQISFSQFKMVVEELSFLFIFSEMSEGEVWCFADDRDL